MLAFDKTREARIAQKDTEVINMDQKLYELEVERTKNLGNMTSVLLMLASSMDALTRSCTQPSSPSLWVSFTILPSSDVYLCGWHFECELDNPRGPPSPFGLPAMLFRHSRDPLVLEA